MRIVGVLVFFSYFQNYINISRINIFYIEEKYYYM